MSLVPTPIKKTDAAQRLVYAEVYAPDRPDSEVEFMRADEIQKAAHGFMRRMALDAIDSQHNNKLVEGACVVESFIARKGDPDFIEGAWVIGMHVDNDDMWAKIEKGEINGFSIEALVTKHPQEIEMEIPPQLSGTTFPGADGHVHTFIVAYDSQGRFLGGETDMYDGHIHTISRGSVTDSAAGHVHKFSHVENVIIKRGE